MIVRRDVGSVGCGLRRGVAFLFSVVAMSVCTAVGLHAEQNDASELVERCRQAMRRAAGFFVEEVASHGGYVYVYTLDLQRRWGEGEATKDQIWVQPPGTPTVGMALLEAYRATGDRWYLDAATRAGEALVYGQLESGGWTNCIDFDPHGSRVARYRNGRGRGKNNSSLDDGQTQSALLFLMHLDQELQRQHGEIRQAVQIGLDALLAAQFPNGGFPQVWSGPVHVDTPAVPASYPPYDWRTEGRIKNYWDMPTINDNVPGYVTETLIAAERIYGDRRAGEALRKLGDFLILAQMPPPQRGWAQQYNYQMYPIWARKFEPPAIASDESQEVIATLMRIYDVTGDEKYLQPIPDALQWLASSHLPDGRLARYYELKTNRPLYMRRQGEQYFLTYSDADLPSHYAWKISSRHEHLLRAYQRRRDEGPQPVAQSSAPDARRVAEIIEGLDNRGRWVERYQGQSLVGQPDLKPGDLYLASQTFSRNLTSLARFVAARRR